VLFGDIAGFTAYGDQHSPDEVHRHLQSLVEQFEQIVTVHGLEKIKTIGDSFMATAGLLAPAENPALACVRCGLAMIEATHAQPPHWRLRVGVHVGPVIAGVVGHRKYQYDVWGDTVNIASRLEQAAAPGTLCVTGNTWTHVASDCSGQSLGNTALKGKGDLELFRIDSVRA
jgi:adenylate cyclase